MNDLMKNDCLGFGPKDRADLALQRDDVYVQYFTISKSFVSGVAGKRCLGVAT